MEPLEVLKPLGITSDWVHTFLTESNAIDPQPGSSEPGSPVYDGHREALLYALYMSADDRYALPYEVYKLLNRGESLGRGLRNQEVAIGGRAVLPHRMIKRELFRWNRRVCQAIDSLRTDEDTIPEERKRAEIWGLHCELMSIHPYDHFNGKVGRILMVNHALLTDAKAWVIPAASRQEYFNTIRQHPSAEWGTNPPTEDQL